MSELQEAYDANDDRAALEAKREILVEAIEAAKPSRRDLAGLMTALNDVDEKLTALRDEQKDSVLDQFIVDVLGGKTKDRKSNQEKMKARIATQEESPNVDDSSSGEPGSGS